MPNENPIVNFFVGLIPPRDDDLQKAYMWRWKVFISLVVALVLGIYSIGMIPGVPEHNANASEMTDLKADVQKKWDDTNKKIGVIGSQLGDVQAQLKNSRRNEISSNLIEATKYYCTALNSPDRSAVPFWTDRIQTLKQEYYDLAGISWTDMPCSSL